MLFLSFAAATASAMQHAPMGGPAFAGAAAMACPVLGAPSIVHRLRSLAMTEVSQFRRRVGLTLLASLGCSLPLTATISYAANTSNASSAPSASGTTEAQPVPVRPGATGAAWLAATQPAPPATAPTTSALPEQTVGTNNEITRAPVPASPGHSRFDDFLADARKRIDKTRLHIEGDRIIAVLEIPDRSSFDAFKADALKRMNEMRARMADSDRNAATSDIYRQSKNGAPVLTIDCKAYRAGEAHIGDSLAAQVCLGRTGIASSGGL